VQFITWQRATFRRIEFLTRAAMKLVAIDFETADRLADSACAIGIVSIEKGKIAKKGYRLIRPPRRQFVFSCIHGISWADVEDQPTFIEVWEQSGRRGEASPAKFRSDAKGRHRSGE
jgi:DNA polymerase III epsilon subunit-like protein